MKPNIGLKRHKNGNFVLVHLPSGEQLHGLSLIELKDNYHGEPAKIVAEFFLKGIRVVGDCVQEDTACHSTNNKQGEYHP